MSNKEIIHTVLSDAGLTIRELHNHSVLGIKDYAESKIQFSVFHGKDYRNDVIDVHVSGLGINRPTVTKYNITKEAGVKKFVGRIKRLIRKADKINSARVMDMMKKYGEYTEIRNKILEINDELNVTHYQNSNMAEITVNDYNIVVSKDLQVSFRAFGVHQLIDLKTAIAITALLPDNSNELEF